MNFQNNNNLKSHFLRLYHMALTDGDFSSLEWRMLYKFAEDRDIPRNELDKLFLSHTGPLTVPEDIESKLEYLYDLCLLIWADESVTEDERNTLKKFCRLFQFEEENIKELTEYLLGAAKVNKPFDEIISELNEA